MPLTPEDVRNRQFGTTRFRSGYDQHEVDAFLELVEEELVDRDLLLEQAVGEQTRWLDPGQEPPPAPGWQADPGPVSAPPTAEGAVTAAARLLEMAEESAASTAAEARREADDILNRAQAEASTILTAARRQAARVTNDAQVLAAQVERSVQERRDDALRPLTDQRDELQRNIAGLQAIARECRSRLRAYADEPLPGLDVEPADQQTVQIGEVVPVSAGGIMPPSGHGNGNGNAPEAWTVPGARQIPDPAVPSTCTGPAPRVPPEEAGSPAPGPDSDPGDQRGTQGAGPR
jgi:DivIVA domain-containing protein